VLPPTTELLGVEITGTSAKVDLSRGFESGGGSAAMLGRVAQVVYTLCDIEGVDSVEFFTEGKPLTTLGGEGLVLEGPQRPEDFTGSVPIVR
jgi:spore germination protein GerM